MLVRAIVLVLAGLACAWFLLGIRQAHDTGHAISLLAQSSLTPAEAARVRSLLDGAAILNPDREVDLARGKLALLEHDRARAERILSGVTRSEPLNLEAWVLLAQAALNRDLPVFGLAIRRIAYLDPKIG